MTSKTVLVVYLYNILGIKYLTTKQSGAGFSGLVDNNT